MDASKKQREPVAFKSLAELKRFIRPGVEFKTVSHANHADMVGLTRGDGPSAYIPYQQG
jgi:hypothetical protein